MSERTFFSSVQLNQKQRTSKRSAMCATSALSARSFDEAVRRRELRPSFVDGGVAAIGVVNAGNVPMSLLGEAGVKESSAAAAPLSISSRLITVRPAAVAGAIASISVSVDRITL